MAMMKITVAQADALLAARKMTRQAQKAARKSVYAEIRQQHSIPKAVKLTLFVETPDNPLYCVIRNKATGKPLDNGIPEPVVTVAAMPEPVPAIPAEVPTKAPETAATPAKKAAKVKAPAPAQVAQKAPKTAKPAAKVAVKAPAQVAQKAPKTGKPVAKAAVKAKPVAKVTQEPAKEIEVRITVDGKRIRIGKAKDEAGKAKLIKAYKKEHGIA
jgi:hypothetical protein